MADTVATPKPDTTAMLKSDTTATSKPDTILMIHGSG